MFRALLNRLVVAIALYGLLLQSCKPSLHAIVDEPMLKRGTPTTDNHVRGAVEASSLSMPAPVVSRTDVCGVDVLGGVSLAEPAAISPVLTTVPVLGMSRFLAAASSSESALLSQQRGQCQTMLAPDAGPREREHMFSVASLGDRNVEASLGALQGQSVWSPSSCMRTLSDSHASPASPPVPYVYVSGLGLLGEGAHSLSASGKSDQEDNQSPERAFLQYRSTSSFVPFEQLRRQGVRLQGLSATTTIPSQAFGAKKWGTYFGEVGKEPCLPSNIHEILASPCPFWPGNVVKDTHLLVLIPATVNDEPFNLNLLEQLIKSPKGGGYSTEYDYYHINVRGRLGAQSPESSYWILMTRDVLEGSRGETYVTQKALVAQHASRTGLPYKLPGALEAATAILSHYVCSGERLYTDDPWTHTRCQELLVHGERDYPVVVGGFSFGGFYVSSYNVDDDSDGVASLLRF
jgi:hypothetical protein